MYYKDDVRDSRIKKIIKDAEVAVILTGAGMGVDSGLPVFRGDHGLWEMYPDIKNLNFGFKDIANPENYLTHPEVAIPFYLSRHQKYHNAIPHDGFIQLLNYSNNLQKKYFTITSNVDGLFLKSGFDKNRIHEIHGNIFKWQCSAMKCSQKHGESGLTKIDDKSKIDNLRCKKCGSYLRPNICMFMDMDYVEDINKKQSERFYEFYKNINTNKIAIIEIGSGTDIKTIRNLSESMAYENNTQIIRINPEILIEDIDDNLVICLKMSAKEGILHILNLLN